MAVAALATSASAVTLLAACSDLVDADLVIRSGTVIDGTGGSPRIADVFVRDGRIALVAPPGRRATAGTEEVDARGRYLIPGLVDGHVHFSLGAPMARRPDETEEVLRRLVDYGVTSIVQMGATGGGMDSIVALRTRQAAGHVSPTVYASGGLLTLLGSHPLATLFSADVRSRVDSMASVTPVERPLDLDWMGIGISVVRSPEAVAEAVQQRAAAGMDLIKITIESGPTPFGDDHPQMSLETTSEVVRQATSHGLPVLAHVSSLDELETAFEGGANGVVHAVQTVPLPDSVMVLRMADRGFYVMPTLVLFDDPDLSDPYLAESVTQEEIAALANPGFLDGFARLDCCAPLEDVLANIAMLHRMGVPIVLGTDTGNPFVFPGYSVHRELELLVAAGLSPASALEAATIRVAEMLGKADEFGTLEEGKRADILVLGADPLVDVRNSRNIEVVVLRGRVVRPGSGGGRWRGGGRLTRRFSPYGSPVATLRTHDPVHPARPRNTSIARFRRTTSSSSSWPVRDPSLFLGTVVILSTMSRLTTRRPFPSLGSTGRSRSRRVPAEGLRALRDAGCAVVISGHDIANLFAVTNEIVWVVAGTSHGIGSPELAVWHASDHYDQLVFYLRMNGLVPPASRSSGDS